ncbi:hypothetical protein [Aquibacillus kalidii]|uniref:hypothetical protein n=1 Tax=Aquibacillus kalidii TaxID=2762597 RepID=UPI001645B9FF|nr:hypothetical protein [Aquibacillus kalidii]
MKVKAIKPFTDLKENVKRKSGDTFVVSQERFKEMNSSRYGELVKEVVEKKTKRASKKVGDK